MEKIVVGISDEASQRAVDWVIERAKRGPVDVSLVLSFDLVTSDSLQDQLFLSRAKERIGASSPASRVTTRLVERSVPESIIPATLDADLLVVGSHHRGFVASALVGRPALALASRSHCATVIVPERWTPTSHGRVVVGLDDDGSSDAAIDFAAREAIASEADLEIVHAWSALVPGVSTLDGLLVDEREMRDVHRADLSAAVGRIRSTAPRSLVTGLLQEGRPSAGLAERAADSDLLVIGSHRRGSVAGMVMGSTAAELLRTLATPICVVSPLASSRDRRSGLEHPEAVVV